MSGLTKPPALNQQLDEAMRLVLERHSDEFNPEFINKFKSLVLLVMEEADTDVIELHMAAWYMAVEIAKF